MAIMVAKLFDYCTPDKMDHIYFSKVVLLILSSCIVLISAQSSSHPTIKCRNVTTIKNFNIKQYMGVWYEYERYDIIAEDDANCIMLNYTLLSDLSFMINNTFVKQNKNNTLSTIVREANVTTHDGILKVQIPGTNQEATVHILGTDYTDYSILWGCLERNNSTPMEFAWVITRKKTLTPPKLAEVNLILQNNSISIKNFIKTKHDPLTCWNKNSASMLNISILLLTFAVTLKYFI